MKIAGILFALAVAQQTILDGVTEEAPTCRNIGKCEKCLFSEIRNSESCYKTGYQQMKICEDNEKSWSTSCKSSKKPLFNEMYLVFIFSFASLLASSYVFSKKKLVKTEEQEKSLSNIIKT